ncbi:PadR family transcriptional regulator [Conexibacter stalactiti]|uniref:PadR family transcriptional regulator n=1 Tax=Conexibacter stalactiti TaxID=1940611 RepID=A0ABU4HWA1_9ACTN|nr:PadR family transcriptional regulator [Conexibacter stalactiti]MDW5597119.1 PadR family transcriptional regulator [Conexibacter stalactiti]MEC5037761.1 PadR family transcriptional regulator [Conexibacter stalactiti]
MLSTNHVVLGLVIDRPGYGYELQQRLDDRLGFLGLSDTVVYRVLDRLEHDDQIVESGPKSFGATRRGSPRVMYVATERGRSEFRRWMREPCERALVRDELHAKLVLAEPGDIGHLMTQVIAQERLCVEELTSLTRAPLRDLVGVDVPWPSVASVLIDEARAIRLQGTIDWLQRVRAVLERRASASSEQVR